MVVGRFAGRLRELRAAAGLSQKELADKAGVTRDGVAQWESGRREPSWGNVLALCEALGVNCDSFTEEPADKPAPERGRPRKTDGQGEPAPAAKKTRKGKGD